MTLTQSRVDCSPLRVIVIDDRVERRRLMAGVVEGNAGMATVVAQADSAEAALRSVEDESADAVLIDVGMPLHEGLRTIRELHQTFPRLGIVACSSDLDRRVVQRALDGGAHAVISKPARHPEVLAALEGARLVAR